MSGLIRLKSDGFSIESAMQLEDGDLLQLLPMDAPLSWMPRLDVNEAEAVCFAQGKTLHANKEGLPAGIVRVYCGNRFLGVGKNLEKLGVKPEKVLV